MTYSNCFTFAAKSFDEYLRLLWAHPIVQFAVGNQDRDQCRAGSVAHNGSGDIFCAVSTANRLSRNATGRATIELLTDGSINEVFSAVVDATEESVCNALFVADTVTGAGGHTVPGLPIDRVMELITRK